MGAAYDMTLKKIISQAGFEMPAENKAVLKVVYNGDIGKITLPVENPTPPPVETDETDKTFDQPVPIDQLPQTGPAEVAILLFLSLIAAFFVQKKLHKGA